MSRPFDPPLRFAPPRVTVERRGNGGFILRSPEPLRESARSVGVWLRQHADRSGSRVFLAERAPGGWRTVTYAEALAAARAIGTALLARGLSAERPVAVLSDNSVDHALLALACQYAGVPYAPVSPAYSLMSSDHNKLRAIFALLEPGLVWVDDAAKFERALAAVAGHGFELSASRNVPPGATPFAALLGTSPDPRVDAAYDAVEPDRIAKFLFTSGSTGEPKAVVNTHRMLTVNQQMIRQCWPFVDDEPPVLVDWLPWNHTFGGNHNFNLVLAHGGTLYVDEGKPAPGLVDRTLANLREVSPTMYFNVPRGFDALLASMERDEGLARSFFARLKLVFYAGAALPQNLWEKLAALAQRYEKPIAMTSAWGSTETAPMVTCVHFPIDRAGVIGLPAPGTELLFEPSGEKFELRVRGPNVTPGYWKRPDLTAAAFDAEGFYRIGDAGRLADPSDPVQGVVFDGRIAEDFKLSTGTWVHVGMLRVKAIAALAPVAQDIVIAGHDRDEIGLLTFPSAAGCASLCPDLPKDTPLAQLVADERVRACVRDGMRRLAETEQGSSQCPKRALLLTEMPSIDAGEITDKGYINQRAVLTRRADEVATLYAQPRHARVIVP